MASEAVPVAEVDVEQPNSSDNVEHDRDRDRDHGCVDAHVDGGNDFTEIAITEESAANAEPAVAERTDATAAELAEVTEDRTSGATNFGETVSVTAETPVPVVKEEIPAPVVGETTEGVVVQDVVLDLEPEPQPVSSV